MRKLILILTLSLSFFNNSHSAENLFCIDLDSKSQWGDFYSIYQIFNKGKSDECSASNLGEGLKNKKLVKFDYENYKKYHNSGRTGQISTENLKKYLKEKNLLKELEYIKLAELYPVVNSNKTNISSAKSQNTSCYKMLEWSWKIPNNFAEFSFTNKGEGNIRIDSIKIITEDGRQVLEESVFINLKPFGIGSSRVFIGDRNKEMLAKASYTCAFISETKTKIGVKLSDLTDDKNSRSDKKSFFENYIAIIIVLLVIILAVVMFKKKEISKEIKKKEIKKDDGFIFGFVRGDESLAKAFWLYFWFGNVVINIFGLLIIDPLYSRETSFLIYLYIIIFLIWNCLALIGVFKSADNYKDDKIKSNQGYGWATTAKIITTILVLSGIGNLIKLL